jgi:hypothetical protein
MNKSLITILSLLIFNTYADYSIHTPLEVPQGGILPDGSIQFKINDQTTPIEPENTAGCIEFDYNDSTVNWMVYQEKDSELAMNDYVIPLGYAPEINTTFKYNFITTTGIAGYLTKGTFQNRYIPDYDPSLYIDNYALVMCSNNIKALKTYCGQAGHFNGEDLCPRDIPSHSI